MQISLYIAPVILHARRRRRIDHSIVIELDPMSAIACGHALIARLSSISLSSRHAETYFARLPHTKAHDTHFVSIVSVSKKNVHDL